MSHVAAPQFIGDDLAWLAFVFTQEGLEEALCGLFVGPFLKVYINHFTALVHGSPKIVLLLIDLNEHLINEKSVAITLVFSS